MEKTAELSSMQPTSFTRIKTFSQCPRRFKHIYIDNNERSDNAVLEYGRKVHKLLERFCKELMLDTDGQRTDPDMQEVEGWFISVQKEIGLADHELKRLERVAEFLSDKTFGPNDIEVEIIVDIDGNLVKSILDLRCFDTSGNLLVVDWKTNKRTIDIEEIAEDLQLRLYAFQCQELYKDMGIKIFRGLWFWRYGGYEPIEFDEPEFRSVLKEKVETLVNAKEFNPSYNAYCASCDILHTCPIKDDLVVYTYGHCKDREKWWAAKAKSEEVRGALESRLEPVQEVVEGDKPIKSVLVEDGYRYTHSIETKRIIDIPMLLKTYDIDFAMFLDRARKMLKDLTEGIDDPAFAAQVLPTIEDLTYLIARLESSSKNLEELVPILDVSMKDAKAAGIDLPIKEEKKNPKLSYTKV